MAVYLETVIKRFIGASTDEMPSGDIPQGSTLHLVDTGECFVFHDDMWFPDLRLSTALQAVQGG